MSPLKLPPAVIAFLERPNTAVIGCVRPDGFPMTVATWYDWEGGTPGAGFARPGALRGDVPPSNVGRVLVNMDESRSRLAWIRHNPKVSLTVLDDDWYRHVSLYGVVVSIKDDVDLADIDRLSQRYRGQPYGSRTAKRVSAWIEPKGWLGWDSSGKVASK